MNSSVTVIIPTCNRETLLGRAIRCVLDQTFADLELIVVDDGSLDNTPSVLKQFIDPRLKVIRHKRNRGLPATRNTGVAQARGEWLAFLDDDDVWHPRKLALQINFMRHGEGKNFPATVTDYYEWNGSAQITHRNSALPDINRAIVSGLGPAMGSTIMVRRETFLNVGKFHEVRGAEDRDWLLRYLTRHQLCVVPEFLMLYAGSHSPDVMASFQALKDVRRIHKNTFKGINPDYHRVFNAGAAWRMAQFMFNNGFRSSQIVHELSHAAMISPRDTMTWAANLVARRCRQRIENLRPAELHRASRNNEPAKAWWPARIGELTPGNR